MFVNVLKISTPEVVPHYDDRQSVLTNDNNSIPNVRIELWYEVKHMNNDVAGSDSLYNLMWNVLSYICNHILYYS